MILEVWGNPGSLPFWNMDEAAAALVQSAKDAGATVLSERWHHFGAGFGYTGVVILSESHISVHTWPEKGYAAIDVFMCGDCDPEDTLIPILAFYQATNQSVQVIKRGIE
jgi:S-adenosylmethionine decarboxylase